MENSSLLPSSEAERWAKALGDVNNDGKLDVLIAERAHDSVRALLAPDWKAITVGSGLAVRTGLAAGDIDGDKLTDVVVTTDDGVVLLHAPSWTAETISKHSLHDVVLADIDGNGALDVVARGQTAFRDEPLLIDILRNQESGWRSEQVAGLAGEGLAVADIDADGRVDIVLNGRWLRNRGTNEHGSLSFEARDYAPEWRWPHAKIAVEDLDSDGRLDIALAPAERAGDFYRLSWFQQPQSDGPWKETVLEPRIEAVQHGLQIADLDRDGRSDIIVAQMHQGRDPDEVAVYFNDGLRAAWSKQVLSREGSHNILVGDIDADGDVDIVGANWSGSDDAVEMWRNLSCDDASGRDVRRHVLGETHEGKNLFVLAADIDRDGHTDVAAGPHWYRSGGALTAAWEKKAIGAEAQNALLLEDFDGDGAADVLYTPWHGGDGDARLGIAWNDGRGNYSVDSPEPAGAGDFPQGVAVIDRTSASTRVAISWHDGGHGVELVAIPTRRGSKLLRQILSESSEDEDLSVGDIDRDGDADLLLGLSWLEQTERGWLKHVIAKESELADRNQLVDMNGDGWLDAVVGFQAISVSGEVVWYEGGGPQDKVWRKHTIGAVIGPMSLQVEKARDQLSVFVGEHNLTAPEKARLLVAEQTTGSWRLRTLWTGDEHHDGLLVRDLDQDGDLDIASVGWSHGRVHVYETLNTRCLRRSE
jgi:hypothetical protein